MFQNAINQGSLGCPNCLLKPQSRLQGGPDDVIVCKFCGTGAVGMEWARIGKDSVDLGHADEVPHNTSIKKSIDGRGMTTWNIPPSGRFGVFMLSFGVFWCLGIFFLNYGFLSEFGSRESKDSDWLMIPFFGLFWAIGLWAIYIALNNRFARFTIISTADQVLVHRNLLGWISKQSLVANTITSVSQKVSYRQNEDPVHIIEIRGTKGKICFGSMLTAEEKAWLVADLQRVILGHKSTNSSAANEPQQRMSSKALVLPKRKD